MMKKIIVSILMLLVLVSSAMAVDVTAGGSSGEVTVSKDAVRSNPEIEGDSDELDDDKEIEYVTFSVPVAVSNGTANITGASADVSGFTYDVFDGEVSDIETVEVTSTFPISVTNTTRNVEIKVVVPSNLDSITSTFDQAVYSVPITIQTTEGSKSVTGKFTVENGLSMGNVELTQDEERYDCDVESDEFDQSLDCDDEIDELVPGEDFFIQFEVDNTFSSSDDLDIEDVTFEIFSDDRDVESDDESFDQDIDSGESYDVTMDFEVDKDVDDGSAIEITITVDGDDVNGAKHGFKYTFDIEFLVPKYDVRVNSLTLSPSTICQGEESTVAFEVENFGSRSQNNVQILIENDDLRVEKLFTRIELEEEDERDTDYKDLYTIKTTPNVDADQYDIKFTVLYDDDGDNELIELEETLTIQDCEGDDSAPVIDTNNNGNTNTDSNVIVVQPTNPTPQQPIEQPSQPIVNDDSNTVAPVTVTAKQSSNVGLVVGLVFAILVLLVVIGIIVAVLMRKD